jgi:hypothetical protein
MNKNKEQPASKPKIEEKTEVKIPAQTQLERPPVINPVVRQEPEKVKPIEEPPKKIEPEVKKQPFSGNQKGGLFDDDDDFDSDDDNKIFDKNKKSKVNLANIMFGGGAVKKADEILKEERTSIPIKAENLFEDKAEEKRILVDEPSKTQKKADIAASKNKISKLFQDSDEDEEDLFNKTKQISSLYKKEEKRPLPTQPVKQQPKQGEDDKMSKLFNNKDSDESEEDSKADAPMPLSKTTLVGRSSIKLKEEINFEEPKKHGFNKKDKNIFL